MTDHWEASFNKEKDKNNKLMEQLKDKDKSYLELKEKLAYLTRVLESERKEENIKRMKERSYLAIKEHKYNKLLKRYKEAEKRCDDLEQHWASEKQNTETVISMLNAQTGRHMDHLKKVKGELEGVRNRLKEKEDEVAFLMQRLGRNLIDLTNDSDSD